jgi:mannose-6-phosphate isomerase-like protein (cupin superfamily)
VLIEPHGLSDEPDARSPGGGADIRHLVQLPQGDLTHATCPPGGVSPVHELPELFEAYYVLAGRGEIWRKTTDREGVTALRPGRWVHLPPGTQFQFRADAEAALVFLVVVLPSWREELFHLVDGGPWPVDGPAAPPTGPDRLVDGWLSGDLAVEMDDVAPDGSEIRLLGGTDQGSLAHCTLHAGHCSVPVEHRTIHEIWFVVEGFGELWRRTPSAIETVAPLWPGTSVDIPPRTAFQFRSTGAGPLRLVLLTMPRWPGPGEAVPATPGRWAPTLISLTLVASPGRRLDTASNPRGR